MSTTSTLRWRRNAAQVLALAHVEREIRASDPNGRRRYLRDFTAAFSTYSSVLSPAELDELFQRPDVLLVGDYHALPASQRFAARLAEQLAASSNRPLILGLETVFARDQRILDRWMRGEIDASELRDRIHFDLDWGYDWQPFAELLESTRSRGVPVYGLDCRPRNDLRRIGARDRHAAAKIAELRERHPDARLVVLFGESHLAPNHLPLQLRQRLPHDRILSVLQNIDQLYWLAAGERCERVEAVRVNDDVVCVFNSTPLEKYESYRLCIERWRRERPAAPGLGPTIYNLIDALLRFLRINQYSSTNHTQPKFLVDLLPEVYCRSSLEQFRRLLARDGAGAELPKILEAIRQRGSCYVSRMNAIFAGKFDIASAAEDAARFVHHACRQSRGAATMGGRSFAQQDRFYARVLEDALAYFGSRVLCPSRPGLRESDLHSLYAQPREAVEGQTIYSYREYMQMLDFLVLHKDFEANQRKYAALPGLIAEGLGYTGAKFDYLTRQLGYMLGSQLYDAYLGGVATKRFVRALFFRSLDRPGAARAAYFSAAQKRAKRSS